MKKKIIIIVSIIAVLVLSVGCAFLIDKSRMNSNKPVIFSTWGYDYAPPEEIIAPPKLYMELESNDDRITAITGTYSWTKIVDGVGQGISSDSVHPVYFDYKEENTILLSSTDKLIVSNENAVIKNVRLYKADVEDVLSYDVLYKDKEITLDMQSNGEYVLEIVVEYPEGKVFYGVKLVVNIKNNVAANDVVTIHHKSVNNIEKLHSFMNNTDANNKNRQDDFIRIIYYTIEGDPIIKDIKYVHNEYETQAYYEVTTDRTADKFGAQTITTEKYDTRTISKKERNGYVDILLTQHPLACLQEELENITICTIPKDAFNEIIEKRSFIATIIEEEPTYLIVKPNDGELEKLQSNTRKILIAGGENRDYLYGVGRKVIITYDNKIQSDTNTIIGADIDTDGYDIFEFEVVESEKLEKRKILNNKELDKLNSDYDLYYYGLEEVNVKVDNKVITLENALKDGYLTMSGILSKANRDVTDVEEQYAKYEEHQSVPLILPRKLTYKDGGSVEFQYETFVIIKFNTVDNNNSMYICKAGTTLNDLNK